MQLLTKELLNRFEKVGRQEDSKDPIVIAKFFNPAGAGTWYATEYDPESKEFFGYVSIFGDWNDEWGLFALAELENYEANSVLVMTGFVFEKRGQRDYAERHTVKKGPRGE